MAWIQDGKIHDDRNQDGCHHQVKWEWMSLSQIDLVWVRVRVEWECFWVNLREHNKVSDSKMTGGWIHRWQNFKMAAIIKLSQNEWVKFFCAKWLETYLAVFKMVAKIKLSQNVWVKFFCVQTGGNPRWQVWRCLRGNTKMAESTMAKFMMAEFKMAAITKLSWDWMSLSQYCKFELRVRVEWECFWVNLREDNKVSDSKMAVSESKHGRIQDGCHHQVESEWMSEVFFVQMVETYLGKCEWVWEEILRWLNPRWQNSWWQNSTWLPSPS